MPHAAPQPEWTLVRRELERLLDLDASAQDRELKSLSTAQPLVADRVAELLRSAAGPGLETSDAGSVSVSALAHELPLADGSEHHGPAGASTSSVPDPILAPAPGQSFGRFALTRLLGVGGMGSVFEATDPQLGRSVALKFLSPAALVGDALARFQSEARGLARLSHPGIAQVYDVGWWQAPAPADSALANAAAHTDAQGVPFIAMEFVPGAAWITAFARDHALSADARLALFTRVLDAVHEAHQRGVIHRDLKPANILVDASGQPKVIDFGIARVLEPAAPSPRLLAGSTASGPASPPASFDSHTVAGAGTLRYMSPESLAPLASADQLSAPSSAPSSAPLEADARADLYSLGVVLYELLEDRSPFPAADSAAPPNSAASLRDQIRAGTARPPSLALLPARAQRAELAAVIAKAMALSPRDRYESVAALAAELRRVRAGEPVQARPASIARELRWLARRHRALAAALLIGLTALTLGAVAAWTGMLHARQALAQKEVESRRLERMTDFFRGTFQSASPATPLDGKASPATEWLFGRPLAPPLRRVGTESASAETVIRRDGSGGNGGVAAAGGGGGAGSATVVDVLRWAAQRVPAEFADDPELRARVNLQIGAHLAAVYQFEGAGRLTREAFETFRAVLGPDHENTLRAQVLLGAFGGFTDSPEQSAQLLADALDRLQRLRGRCDYRTEYAIRALVRQELLLGRHAQAAARLDAFLPALIAELGPDAERVHSMKAFRAHVLLSGPSPTPEAAAQLDDAYRHLLRIAGPAAESTIDAASYGMQLPATPDATRPIAYARAAIDGLTRLRGPASAHEARTALARLLMRQRDLAGAEAVLREQLNIAALTFGDSSYVTCKVKGFLARVLTWARKDLDEALRLSSEAARDSLQHVGTGKTGDWEAWFHALAASATRLRAEPSSARAAEATLRELAALRAGKSLGAWCDAYIHIELAEALLDQGRVMEAQPILAAAAAFTAAMDDPGSPIDINLRETQARSAVMRRNLP